MFTPEKICSVDETANITVHTDKAVACNDNKQVESVTSGESAPNVTFTACLNALGYSILPMFIYPDVHLK